MVFDLRNEMQEKSTSCIIALNMASQCSTSLSFVSHTDDFSLATTDQGEITKSKKLRKRPLGLNYHPGAHAVACGRGKVYSLSTGNRFLKALVNHYLISYSIATTKAEKSQIVTTIIDIVHAAPDGIFIRFQKGQWWEVDDAFAREKIGSLFRDTLFTKYRSSTKAKMAKKKEATTPPCGDVDDTQAGVYSPLSTMFIDLDTQKEDSMRLQEPTRVCIGKSVSCSSISQVSMDDDKDDDLPIPVPPYSQSSWQDQIAFNVVFPHTPSSSTFFPPPLRRQGMHLPRQVSEAPIDDDETHNHHFSNQRQLQPSAQSDFEAVEFPDDMICEIDALDSFLQDCF